MRSARQTLKTILRQYLASMAETVSELSVPVPWGHIRGKAWGPEHGHPVLCLHGWADNCGTFNQLIPLLPKGCRYVALDLAGHGLSSHRPPGTFYCIPSYVADVRRVVDALQLTKLSIIGHSMVTSEVGAGSDINFELIASKNMDTQGGDIAGMFSVLYPELVEGLVLLDVQGFLPTDTKDMSRVMRQGINEMIRFEKSPVEKKRVYTYEKAVERLLAANPTLSEQSVHILLERGLVQVEGGFVFSRDLRVNFRSMVIFSLEQCLEMQARVRASVLVVLSEDGLDKMLFEPIQKDFVSTISQCWTDRNHTVMTVPGDHHIHLNHPEVVAPFVSDFLQNKVLSDTAKL